MAPKSKSAQRRRSARIQIDEPVSSPSPSLLSPQPVISPESLAIVPFKGLGSSRSEESPRADPVAQSSPMADSVAQSPFETANTSSVQAKPFANQKKLLSKGEIGNSSSSSPSKGRKSVVWRKVPEARSKPGKVSPSHLTRSASKTAVSSPPSSSPEAVSPPCKKQKGSSSSQQVSIPKPLSIKYMLELVSVPQIIQERSFLIDELGGLFKQAVLRQGWEEMLARMASARLNLTLVREFYASLAAALGSSRQAESLEGKAFSIRGRTILFSPSNIGYALGLPASSKEDKEGADSALKLITKEHVVECCYMHPPSKMPGELCCGLLHVSHRALGHLVRALLYPTTQSSQLPLAEAKLLCLLATENKKLPAEFFLFESIKRTAITIARGKVGPKSTLFHPAVISILCQHQDIETHEGDEIGELMKMTMSSVIRGNAQCLPSGPNLDVEAALNVAKKTAAVLEDKADRRIAALEDAVNGLRKDIVSLHRIVGSLHDAFVSSKLLPPSGAVNEAEDAFDSPAI